MHFTESELQQHEELIITRALAEKDRELQQIREHEFQTGYREAEAIWEEKYQQLMEKAVRFAEWIGNDQDYYMEIHVIAKEFLDSPEVQTWKGRKEDLR